MTTVRMQTPKAVVFAAEVDEARDRRDGCYSDEVIRAWQCRVEVGPVTLKDAAQAEKALHGAEHRQYFD